MNSSPSDLISYCLLVKKNSGYRESIGDLFCRFTLYSKEDFLFSSPIGDALNSMLFIYGHGWWWMLRSLTKKKPLYLSLIKYYTFWEGLGDWNIEDFFFWVKYWWGWLLSMVNFVTATNELVRKRVNSLRLNIYVYIFLLQVCYKGFHLYYNV